MSTELRDLLDQAVPDDLEPPDAEALIERGLRRRRRRRAGAATAGVLAVALAGVALDGLVEQAPLPVIGEQPDVSGAPWTPVADSPLSPREQPAVGVDGDRVLLWGGTNPVPEGDETDTEAATAGSLLQDGAVYDAATDEWSSLPDGAPLRLRARPWVGLDGATAVVWGGDDHDGGESTEDGGTTKLMDGVLYDLTADTWEPIPPAPLAPRTPAAVDWDGERLLVWGGTDRDAAPLGDGAVWTLDDGWTPIAPFPLAARAGAAIAWDQDRVVVWGGGSNLDPERGEEQLLADGAVYDRDADRWAVLPDVALPSRWFSYDGPRPTTWLDDDRFHVVGGAATTPLQYFRDGAMLDLSTGVWAETSPVPAAARFAEADDHGAYAVADGTPRDQIWFLDPVGGSWRRIEVPASWTIDATATARIVAASGPSPLGDERRRRPVTVVSDDGATRSPAVGERDRSRASHAVVALDGGVLVWGGSTLVWNGDGVTDSTPADTGWFLPVEG